MTSADTTTTTAAAIGLLQDRAAIADAMHRFAAGLDLADADLLTSSLTEDAVVDVTPATDKIGLEFPVLGPREMVVGALMAGVGPLDTSHSLSNLRIDVTADTATVRCNAQVMHFPPGEGPDPARTRHALLMNRYTAALVRHSGTWRIKHLLGELAWFQGDPAVLGSPT
ncbi:nuclear transport factor 2 family protein [Streptomyces sp. NPDC088354]|uniref:nuclear transport factor 2 family protein n=1 Tax=Streptomyces sp. NPDC088354 TaxID=3365856 RepID=UPI00382F3A52